MKKEGKFRQSAVLERLRRTRRWLNDSQNVIFLTEDGHSPSRRYTFRPKQIVLAVAGGVCILVVGTLLTVALTPLKEWIPGYSTDEIRSTARLNSIKMASVQDSLNAQQVYLDNLRALLQGGDLASAAESSEQEDRVPAAGLGSAESEPIITETGPPAVDVFAGVAPAFRQSGPGVVFPALSPVEGFLTRQFDESKQHYGVDFAIAQGTPVKAIAPGRVVFADWTHTGGYAIAVQHLGGYVSVYMHNKLLSKEVGDTVGDRETIALSGNTGEVSSGPHLHFELWRDGRPLDPRTFFANRQENEK